MAVDPAPCLTVRGLDPGLMERLRLRAARHGRSMEAEVRAIFRDALATSTPTSGAELADAIRRRFAPFGGAELEIPLRSHGRVPPRFE